MIPPPSLFSVTPLFNSHGHILPLFLSLLYIFSLLSSHYSISFLFIPFFTAFSCPSPDPRRGPYFSIYTVRMHPSYSGLFACSFQVCVSVSRCMLICLYQSMRIFERVCSRCCTSLRASFPPFSI
jgi:hypothetical protein